MKNRDKLNNMSNKELAELLSFQQCSYCQYQDENCCILDDCICAEGIKLWLESEAE